LIVGRSWCRGMDGIEENWMRCGWW
jgi:hypothetical protein